MILGLDYYDTITRNRDVFRQLAESLCSSGHQVHIVSAVKEQNVAKLMNNLYKDSIQCDSINPVIYVEHQEIPQLKLAKCQELGIEFFIDDMKAVCELLNANGIMAGCLVGGSFDRLHP